MKKKSFIATVVIILTIALQVSLRAQGAELFRYENQQNLNFVGKPSTVLSKIKDRPTSQHVYIVKFSNLQQVSSSESILLNLPEKSIVVNKKYGEQVDANTFAWYGTFSDVLGEVFLSATQGDITGVITYGKLSFSIEPLGNGFHALVLIDKSKYLCQGQCIYFLSFHHRRS